MLVFMCIMGIPGTQRLEGIRYPVTGVTVSCKQSSGHHELNDALIKGNRYWILFQMTWAAF